MKIKETLLTIFGLVLSMIISANANSLPTQESILDALIEKLPSSVIASRVDKLIKEAPTCSTVEFLRSILQNYPSDKRLIFRIARRFNQLKCQAQTDSLKQALLQAGEQLSIAKSVIKLLDAPIKSTTEPEQSTPPFFLQVQEGFHLKSDFRAALSPSKRYLSVNLPLNERGTTTIWDLKTGYSVTTLPQPMSFLSIFFDDRYMLVASPLHVGLWDFLKNKHVPLLMTTAFPTFLALSPDKKHFVVNKSNGDFTIYDIFNVEPTSDNPVPFQLKSQHIVTDLNAQIGQFIDNNTLLLGSTDSKLLLYDIEQKKVLSSLFLGDLNELWIKKKGDTLFEIMRTLGNQSGIQQITVSEDGQRYAVLVNKQKLALVERASEQLNLVQKFEQSETINAALFIHDKPVILTDSQLLYLDFEGHPVANFKLPTKLKQAKWMQKVADTSIVLLGNKFLSIYDLNRRTVLSHNPAKISLISKLNTRLLDANNILFYTQENGLRRVNLSKLPGAIITRGALFELLYRSGLNSEASTTFWLNLDKYQDILYWIEEPRSNTNNEIYFYYLLPPFSKLRFLKIPESVKDFSLQLEEIAYKSNMEQHFKAIAPKLFSELKQRVAFNGEELAFVSDGKLKLLSVNNHQVREFLSLTDSVKLAFHPQNKQWLIVAGQKGQIEIWDIRQKRRVQKVELSHKSHIARLFFDRSGQYLAIVSINNHLDIWKLSKNEIVFSKAFGDNFVSSVAFDPESTRMIVIGMNLDGTGANLLLVDLKPMTAKTYHANISVGIFGEITFGCDSNHFIETNLLSSELSLHEITTDGIEKRLSLLFLDDGEAIFSEPSSGQYWSTREGAKYVTFRSDNKISRIDQLKARLSDDDTNSLIQTILQCKEQQIIVPPSTPTTPPQVEILSPQISPLGSHEINQSTLPFKLRLKGKQIIESITVIVNGTKRQTWTINSKRQEIEVVVDSLQPGYNHVSFIATDTEKNTNFPFGYTIYVTAESEDLPELFFLGIGADGEGTEYPLKFPYQDAKLIASHFATINKGKYWNKIHTQVLEPSEITPSGVEKALSRLSRKLTADDLLIIYLSGHGRRAKISGEPIFVTNKGVLLWKKIAKRLAKIKARTLVLLDACRSGDVSIEGTSIDNNSLVADLIAERDAGILVFSAARSWQNTYEWQESGNSFFAEAISKSFDEKVDINLDGVISLSEFYEFTTVEVEQIATTL